MKKIMIIFIITLVSLNLYSKEIWRFNKEIPGTILSDIDSYDSEHIFFTTQVSLSRCYMSVNGGDSWENIMPLELVIKDTNNVYDGYPFYTICAYSEDLILIGAAEGRVYRTTNLGTTWDVINIGSNKAVFSIKMYDGKVGVLLNEAINGLQTIQQTKDGGLSWENMNMADISARKYIRSIELFDKMEYSAVITNTKNETLQFKTKDGGETWYVPDSTIHTTSFYNDHEGIGLGFAKNAAGNTYNQFYYTSDRGESWTKKAMSDTLEKRFGNIYFVNENRGIYVSTLPKEVYRTNTKEVHRSIDSVEFETYYSGMMTLKKIHFVSDKKAFLLSSNHRVYTYEYLNSSVDDTELVSVPQVNLYPNPIHAGEVINFDLPSLVSGKATIFDIDGQIIDSQYCFGNSVRLKENIVTGTYFIVIESDGEIIAREKFIVE